MVMKLKRLILAAALGVLTFSSTRLFGEDFAILDSNVNTYGYSLVVNGPNCSGWNLGADSYKRDWTAWQYVIKHEFGVSSYRVIQDADVTPANLKNFKVLVLANNLALDDAESKTIIDWVRGGGRLIATFGTGYAGIDGGYYRGATNGLHPLWGDPSTKANSSYFLGNPRVDVQVTDNTGPLKGFGLGQVISYGVLSNIVNHRPTNNKPVEAFLTFDGVMTNYPAVIYNAYSKGQVIYYSFSPEFFVALAYDTAGHCPDDNRYGMYVIYPNFYSSFGDPAPGLQFCTASDLYAGYYPQFTSAPSSWPCDNGGYYRPDSAFIQTFYQVMKAGLLALKP